ncbi:GerMN domain-containing protein [Phormidesmis priestleyi]
MQDQQPNRRISIGVIAGLSALMVTGGSAAAFLAWHSAVKEKSVETAPIEQIQPSPSPSSQPAPPPPAAIQQTQKPQPKVAPAPAQKTVEIYYLKDVGGELKLTAVPVKLKSDDRSEMTLTAAIETLLTETPDQTLTSVIPPGTQLRSLKVKPDGIHIDLSQAFTTGGGSASMMGRVAQILYTATSANPNAPVFLSVEGKPLETLGGEGLMLDQPMTRQGFEKEEK